jgi:hypothetical protein
MITSYIFPRFGMFYIEKSGNPAAKHSKRSKHCNFYFVNKIGASTYLPTVPHSSTWQLRIKCHSGQLRAFMYIFWVNMHICTLSGRQFSFVELLMPSVQLRKMAVLLIQRAHALMTLTYIKSASFAGLPDFPWYELTKTGKLYQMNTNYAKRP